MAHHLASIDANAWPGVASVPGGMFTGYKARKAEAEFAKACVQGGIELDGDDPDLRVAHDALFSRIAHSGWLGLAESYMAGEWSTPNGDRLVRVLTRLLAVNFHPKGGEVSVRDSDGGELPAELIALCTGDGMSISSGVYATGVPTTVRESVTNFAGSPRSSQPKAHFVDVTHVSEPSGVDRDDLSAAQERAADWLLDAARVGAGSYVLVCGTTGAQPAIRAAHRRATSDVLTADEDHLHALNDQLVLAGAKESVHTELISSPVPSPKQWRGHYDAVVSVEALETLSPRQQKAYIAGIDRFLSAGGRAAVQTIVATDAMSPAGRAAANVLRAYIWPGLNYSTMMDVHKLCDKNSGLRIIAESHLGSHYKESLRQQRSFFEGHLREAAAAGFDPVFRRLWLYQFALREALVSLGMTDAIQYTATHRHRGGRR